MRTSDRQRPRNPAKTFPFIQHIRAFTSAICLDKIIVVRTDPGNAKPPPAGSLGEIKWDGASGCLFVVDRKQDMFFVLLEQTPSERQKIQPAVKRLIYEAMEN